MDETKVDQLLDTRGLNCPIPVLNTGKVLESMQAGHVLEVISTDPGIGADMKALMKRLGHEIMEIREKGKEKSFLIRKKG